MTRQAMVAAVALLLGGCATAHNSVLPSLVPGALEARQAQSRSFEVADQRLVLKAALNVLQDEGFVVRQVNLELGMVTAVKEWRSARANTGLRIAKWIAAPMTYGASLLIPSGSNELTAVEAIVNVSPESERTRVRISLVAKVTSTEGRVRSVQPVEDARAYQDLLAHLDRAVYLEKEGL